MSEGERPWTTECPVCCLRSDCGCLDEPEPTGPKRCGGVDGAVGCYQVEGHAGPCDVSPDRREVSPAELKDLRARIDRHRKIEPRKLYAGQITAAWSAWSAAGEVIERIAALLGHIDFMGEQVADLFSRLDALTAENAELRGRAERAEAHLLRLRDAVSSQSESPEHSVRLARDTRMALNEERRAKFATLTRIDALRVAATRIAASPTAEGARELAALVLGGEER